MAATSLAAELGRQAPDFSLPGVDGKLWALDELTGRRGTVVVFICNHCPYVQAVIDRMVEAAKALATEGIGFVAISSNDVGTYPEDSFDNMRAFAKAHRFPFPYLYDESQDVARAYGAVCTPDYFGLDAEGRIQYRGRLDGSRKEAPPPGAKRELVDAMVMIAETGRGPVEQIPSVGCSMKWKEP